MPLVGFVVKYLQSSFCFVRVVKAYKIQLPNAELIIIVN